MLVQVLITEFATERIDVRILRRLTGLNQLQSHTIGIGALVERSTCELEPLVRPYRFGIIVESIGSVQWPSHIQARNTMIDNDVDRDSFVKSLTIVRHLIRRPLASASTTKSIDHTSFGDPARFTIRNKRESWARYNPGNRSLPVTYAQPRL